jgi:hypothetical protein
VIHGALFERDPNFTPVKIYRKRINVSEINLFPNLPERIGGLEGMAYDLWWIWHPARMPFKMLNRLAWKESVYNPVKMLSERELTIDMQAGRNLADEKSTTATFTDDRPSR